MELGVYVETFLQAVMSVSRVVQLKFYVAVMQSTLEPHHVCHVREKGEKNYKPNLEYQNGNILTERVTDVFLRSQKSDLNYVTGVNNRWAVLSLLLLA